MAKDGEAMTSKRQAKKRWAAGRAIPKFATAADEERFWLAHDFDDLMEARGEEVVYEPQATRRPRTHVYRVRLDDQEMSKLQTLAKRRGVTASVILRELVRAARVASGGERRKQRSSSSADAG
jgi:CopG antitoxin of type II toxin-antitoxin system